MSALADRMMALRRRLLSADIDPATLPPFAFRASDVREMMTELSYHPGDPQSALLGSPVQVAGFRGYVVRDECE